MGKRMVAFVVMLAVAIMCWSAASATYYLTLTIDRPPEVSVVRTPEGEGRASWSVDPTEAGVDISAPADVDMEMFRTPSAVTATCTATGTKAAPSYVTLTITAS